MLFSADLHLLIASVFVGCYLSLLPIKRKWLFKIIVFLYLILTIFIFGFLGQTLSTDFSVVSTDIFSRTSLNIMNFIKNIMIFTPFGSYFIIMDFAPFGFGFNDLLNIENIKNSNLFPQFGLHYWFFYWFIVSFILNILLISLFIVVSQKNLIKFKNFIHFNLKLNLK
ncbi:hypothetical protein ACW95P_02500 [Candidatus Mycoplasma pogonae]